jgi:hypothetical protein
MNYDIDLNDLMFLRTRILHIHFINRVIAECVSAEELRLNVA